MRRISQILFYVAFALVWLIVLLYPVAVVVTFELITRPGRPWWASLPDALRPAFLQASITTWQTGLAAGLIYLVAVTIVCIVTIRLILPADRVKERVDPGNGPVLLSDIWFEPEAETVSRRRWWRFWRQSQKADAAQATAQVDPLGYGVLAHRIAQTIMRSADEAPFAIAIEGRWGIGKTSLMKLIEKELKGGHKGRYFDLPDNDVTTSKDATTQWRNFTIWFNPWRHRRRDAQKAFMNAVFSEIPWRALSWWRSPFMLRRLANQVTNLASFVRGRNGMGGSITNKFDVNAVYRNRFQSDFQAFLQYWSRAEHGVQINLVIFIDDLDRCAPTDISPILESMKLFLETKHCVFVLGFDPDYVARSIVEDYHGLVPDGLVYLQKLVQAEVQLPQPSDARLNDLLVAYQEKSRLVSEFEIIDTQLRQGPHPEDYHKLIREYTRRTPRQMKRVINGLVLSLPQYGQAEYGNAFYLILWQIRWPLVYQVVIEESEQRSPREVLERLRQVVGVD
jgi:hypothetical protein